MPLHLESIDQIARRMQSDVLMLSFCDVGAHAVMRDAGRDIPWCEDASRHLIVGWLARNGFRSEPCMPSMSPSVLAYPYAGHLFIDLPCDAADSRYRQLVGFMEDADGRCVHEGVGFFVLRISRVLRAGHGEMRA